MRYRILHFFNIREGELRATALFFAYLTAITVAYLLGKPIRDGLFLQDYRALDAAYCYLPIALTVGVFVSAYLRLGARISHRALSTVTLLFFTLNVLTFWWLFTFHRTRILSAALYVWTNTFGIIALVQVWTYANAVFDTRQAKRLFGVIGAGGMLGSTLGSLLTGQLATRMGTVNLLLLFAGVLLLTVGIANLTYSRVGGGREVRARSRGPGRSALLPALRLVMRTRYLSLIAALLAVEAIATLWVGVQFLYVSRAFIKGRDTLTAFFGQFQFYVSLSALVMQFFMTSRIMRTLGIGNTILLLPASLAASTGWLLSAPGFWAGIAPKMADQTLRYSIDKSTLEMLYLPVPREIKQNVKAAIDMVLQRSADATAGLLILLPTWLLGWNTKGVSPVSVIRQLSAINLALFITWLGLALAVRREYVAVVRRSIARREVDPDAVDASLSQPAALDVLCGMLEQREERPVLYALDLLERFERLDLVPRSVLRHPSPAVRARAIEVFRRQGDKSVAPELRALTRDPEAMVGASAVLALSAFRGENPREALLECSASADPRMRAAAFVALAAEGGAIGIGEGLAGLSRMAASPDERERVEVARVLAKAPEVAHDLLFHLLEDSSHRVQQAAMMTAAETGRREFVPLLLNHLGEYHCNRIAAEALLVYGQRIIGLLRDVLKDPNEPLAIRQQLPALLARIPLQDSVDALMVCLDDPDGLLRFRAIKALGKLRARSDDLLFDRATVRAHVVEEIRKLYRLHEYLDTLLRERPPGLGIGDLLLPRAMEERVDRGIERIFRLLGLIGNQRDLYHAYLAVTSGDQRRHASGVELLDNVLEPSLKQIVLPLVDEMSQQERAKIGRVLFRGSDLDAVGVLQELIQHDQGWLAACAIEAIGAWRVEALYPDVVKLKVTGSTIVAETASLVMRGAVARAS